ncbi:MAG: phenylalanine--tRNA ligase subunit beta [Planctomycetota bacterium]|nr:phenylalanine--tRNA ligase subunit beta [Planctomycetota bacterium]
MDLSLNWLSDHVDLSGIDPQTLAHELTMRTALIEGFVDQRVGLSGVVVGEVLECGPHPGADRLRVCKVSTGDGSDPAHVVCGAPNVAAGQKVVYAPVGTRLPNGIKLKKAKIRGEPSEGMICAEDELGLGPEHDGILVLEGSLEPGTPVSDLPGFADVIFDIDNKSITHRPDLWGQRGFARELAVIFSRELKPLALGEDLVAGDFGPAIELEEGCGCSLYAGLCLDGVSGRSPDWLRFRLVACGMRPINLAVDLSNYVMLELGQPTHPFDRDKLAGDRITVRRGKDGETLTTLDAVERQLTPADAVISDGARGVAIAGVMGSADAEVSEETSRVFLESASFDAVRVRKTSGRLGLRTEALARFEKGLDPGLVHTAVRRYAELMRQLAPSMKIHSTYRVVGDAVSPKNRLSLDTEMVRRRLGLSVADDEMTAALTSLGYEVSSNESGGFEVEVPAWRASSQGTLPEDLVEEIGRIVGYERIDVEHPVGPMLIGTRAPTMAVEENVRDVLATRASCTEVYSYSTVRDKTAELLQLELSDDHPRLVNALQKGASRLRPSVVPELLMRLETWLRQSSEARLFEVGRSYSRRADGSPTEHREIAVVIARRDEGDDRELVREMRAVAEAALQGAGRLPPTFAVDEEEVHASWWHPRRVARLEIDGRRVGTFGAIDPGALARLDLDVAAAALVLDSDALAECLEAGSAYQSPSRQPPAHIDLAFVASYDVSTDELVSAIRSAGPRTLKKVEPFDVFRGGTLAEGERSIAFHLTFQSKDKTLSENDVNRARDRIVKGVEEVGARLR